MPFHMPGHLLGKGLVSEFKSAGAFDITEIPGSDCLHQPEGVIKEAQEQAAKCFGSGYTIFLVNGSTSGIHTMIQSVVKPGGKLIVGRDCHVSAINALALINAEPIFVFPQMDEKNQIPLGIRADDAEKAFCSNPDAQGILITRPNYYGIAQPVEEFVTLAKRLGIPLLVDEAHGAHFKFNKKFPITAMKAGADLCVQSLHKTLPALTQTALLHGKNGGLINKAKLEAVASMIQTTSPSYLLMASIDLAREELENSGIIYYDKLWENIKYFNDGLSHTCIERIANYYEDFDTDFSRIVLSFNKTSLSGFQAEKILKENYGIVVEMADLGNIILIATPFHTEEDFDKLLLSLRKISDEYGIAVSRKIQLSRPLKMPERVLPLRDALFSESREIPINESEGAISALSIIPYPPGIPLLTPGEKITAEYIEYIGLLLISNCPIHGLNKGNIQIISTG